MTRLQNDINSIKRALWEASSVFLACIIVTSILYLEVVIIGGTCGEDSLVEAMQVLLLFVSSILFLQVAETTKHIAGGMYLISGFILCMALRELDAVTDLIPYLSWVHLVAIAVSAARLACVQKQRYRDPRTCRLCEITCVRLHDDRACLRSDFFQTLWFETHLVYTLRCGTRPHSEERR